MSDEDLQRLLRSAKTIAVVGCSTQPGKPSHEIPRPVHLSAREILGERVYPSLADVPGPIDIVDVFRPSEEVPTVVDAAIARAARAVWLQQGISHPAAAATAQEAGLEVVMDLCIMQAHRRLGL